jgi:hypothetical protein
MIRYWDRPGGIQPAKVEGGSRLYTLVDLALLRLVGWLHPKVSRFQLRATLAYSGGELRTSLPVRSNTVFVMTPTTAATLTSWPRVSSTSSPLTAIVPLKDVWAGLPAAARNWRTNHPKVWAGHWRPAHEAARLVKEAVA